MPKPRGGSISPLEKHADFLAGLIEEQPDLMPDEVVLAMHKHRIPGSRTRGLVHSCASARVHFSFSMCSGVNRPAIK